MDIELSKEFQDKVAYIKEHLNSPLYLTGLMGCGKSKLGKQLAKIFNVDFVDADQLIVDHAGKSIPEIFDQDGEEHFRKIEKESVITTTHEQAFRIIALGGGAFMNDEARGAIQQKAISIFLRATIDTLSERVGDGKDRPKLTENPNKTPREVLEGLIDDRYPTYGEANITVDIDDQDSLTKEQSIQGNVERVIDALYTHLNP